MGFIDAVRAWLFGADADGAGESGDETGSSGGDETDASATEGDEPDGLDPAAATETRTATATDDAVDALRDVRQSQEAAESQEAESQEPPDDDRPKSSDDGGTNR
jgi:ABC-type oligopeptide transport system substrate-binding subunit